MNKLISSVKLISIYLFIGVFCGVVGTLFSKGVSLATNIRQENPWLLYFLPLAGIFSVLIYKFLKVTNIGTNQVIASADGKTVLTYKLAPAVFFASILSHLCGASVGREGAALQIGGGSAIFFSKFFKLSEKQEKTLIYCGMAGVFSSVFGTPLSAAVFALEVVFVGRIYFPAAIGAFISSFTSYYTAVLLGAHSERFVISVVPEINFSVLWKILVLSLLAMAVGIIFCFCLKHVKTLFKKLIKNDFLRIVFGAIAIVLLTFAVGSYDYNGAGIHVIEKVFRDNTFVPTAFALKILFTCISVGVGFKGGEIVPTLFIGATLGAFGGTLLGLPVAFSAALCMISLFCCVTNCPLASMFLAAELFFGKGLGYFFIAVIINFCLSGKISLYSTQKSLGFKALF